MSGYKVDEIYIEDDDKGKVYCVRVEWRHCNAEEGESAAVEWNMLGYRLETCIDFGDQMTFPSTPDFARWRRSADFADYYEAEIQEEVNALWESEGCCAD